MTGFDASSCLRNPAKNPLVFEQAVRTYGDALVRYAYSIVGSSVAAEEVMEDTFALLYVKGGNFPTDAHLRSWLYKAAHGKAVDYLRRNKREVPLEDVEQVLGAGSPEEDAIRSQRNRQLYICLQKLPQQYREVLQLHYFDGFSPTQVAAIIGADIKQVYNRLSRGRIALKELLIKEGITYEDI